ncbi:hypothetical protein CDAR_91861 [Caerostris darwini]|uniref:Uncharacterized protein n=1 Tax=Caerostris darwini TaxID=1538125 RepID=A0AAV4QR29_9ARAC|nr:hypothetical protein CDAR_91861 [Caerostris darwini]
MSEFRMESVLGNRSSVKITFSEPNGSASQHDKEDERWKKVAEIEVGVLNWVLMPPVQRTAAEMWVQKPNAFLPGTLHRKPRCRAHKHLLQVPAEYMENEVLPALPGAPWQKNVLRYFPVEAFPTRKAPGMPTSMVPFSCFSRNGQTSSHAVSEASAVVPVLVGLGATRGSVRAESLRRALQNIEHAHECAPRVLSLVGKCSPGSTHVIRIDPHWVNNRCCRFGHDTKGFQKDATMLKDAVKGFWHDTKEAIHSNKGFTHAMKGSNSC